MNNKTTQIIKDLVMTIVMFFLAGLFFLPIFLLLSEKGIILIEFFIYLVVLFIAASRLVNFEKINQWRPLYKNALLLLVSFFILNSIMYYSNLVYFDSSFSKVINHEIEGSDLKVYEESPFLYGYKTASGNTIIDAVYLDAKTFAEGLGAVRVDDKLCKVFEDPLCKWGYIDTQNNFIIEPIFDDANSFSEGKAGAVLDSGFIYEENPEVDLEFEYYWFKSLKNKANRGKWGFINKKGVFVINPQFDEVRDFSENHAAVKVNGKWGYIDAGGTFVIEPVYKEAYDFHDEIAPVHEIESDLWGYINQNGEYIIEPKFNLACNFNNGLAAVKHLDGKDYLINSNGEKVKVVKGESRDYIPETDTVITWPYRFGNCENIYYENFIYTFDYRLREIVKRLFFIIYVKMG